MDYDFAKYTVFEQLCNHSIAYINDKHNVHFGWCNMRKLTKNGNMYELTNDFDFIKEYLIKLNKAGFFTTCSQPGKEVEWIPSCFNVKTKRMTYLVNDNNADSIRNVKIRRNSKGEIIREVKVDKVFDNENTYTIQCKAFVSGYINEETIRHIQQQIDDSSNIVCLIDYDKINRSESMNHILAQTFKNDEICTRDELKGSFVTTPLSCPFPLSKLKELCPNLSKEYFSGSKKLVPVLFYWKGYKSNNLWKELLDLFIR